MQQRRERKDAQGRSEACPQAAAYPKTHGHEADSEARGDCDRRIVRNSDDIDEAARQTTVPWGILR